MTRHALLLNSGRITIFKRLTFQFVFKLKMILFEHPKLLKNFYLSRLAPDFQIYTQFRKTRLSEKIRHNRSILTFKFD